jgi:hypothetical protein
VPLFIETGNTRLIPYYHEFLGLFKKKLGNSPTIPGKNRKFGSKKAKNACPTSHLNKPVSGKKTAQSRGTSILCHKNRRYL